MFTYIKQFVYINRESNTEYPTQVFTHWVQTLLGNRNSMKMQPIKESLMGLPKSLGALGKYTLFRTPFWRVYSWTNSACRRSLGALVKPTSSNNNRVSPTPSLSLILISAPSSTRPSIVYSFPSFAAVCIGVCWEREKTLVSVTISHTYGAAIYSGDQDYICLATSLSACFITMIYYTFTISVPVDGTKLL